MNVSFPYFFYFIFHQTCLEVLYKMSVPFSNTNLRIPKGFGNLLEGLAREVLRDQPEDIPTYAALYFTELLKAREGD